MTNQLSKNIFPEIFSDGHLCYSFDKRANIFPEKVQVSLLKVRAIEKKTVFQSKVPTNVSYKHVHCCFGSPRKLIWHGTKKLLQIQISNKKHSFSVKRIDFPQNFPVDARMAFVTTLKKISSIRLLFFCLKFQGNLKQYAKFQTCFFPQSLPRLRRLQFWQLWRTFPTEWTEEFAQNPKKLVNFSLFRKDFP